MRNYIYVKEDIIEYKRKDGSYYETAESLMTFQIRSELINLKDLKLEISTDQKFTRERLEIYEPI